MTHRQSTEQFAFRPSRRVIASKDSYMAGDYLAGPPDESIPDVGSASSPRRWTRRSEQEIKPAQDRESYEREKAERARVHADLRRERLRKLNESENQVNGYGERYVPIQKIIKDPNQNEGMQREANVRLRQGPARYFGDGPSGNAAVGRPQAQYSSDIGFSRFGLAAAGSDVVGQASPRRQYNHNAARDSGNIVLGDYSEPMPTSARNANINRRADAFTISDNWLAEDSNPASNIARPSRRTFYHNRSVDIISGAQKQSYPSLSGIQVTEDVPVAAPPSGIQTFRRGSMGNNPINPRPVDLPRPPVAKPTAMGGILGGIPVASNRPTRPHQFVNNIY